MMAAFWVLHHPPPLTICYLTGAKDGLSNTVAAYFCTSGSTEYTHTHTHTHTRKN
jgi:hypothetical protein